MKLYIKQKLMSFKDKFHVYGLHGEERYYVEGDFTLVGKRLHVYDNAGREVAFICHKTPSFPPKFFVSVGGQEVALIEKEFTFARPKYRIVGPGWKVEGEFWTHNYRITKNDRTVVRISKQLFTIGDSYELDIESPEDEIVALAVVLAIDCVLATK